MDGAGNSPAWWTGWADAKAGEPMAPGCSPAYAQGYNDYLDETERSTR